MAAKTRITGGTWVLFEQGEPVAQETWREQATPEGPRWTSEIRSSFPWPHATRLAVNLGPDLAYRDLTVDTDPEDGPSTRYSGHMEEGLWIARRRIGEDEDHGFYDWNPRNELDYPASPLFTTLALKRLRLAVGEAREVEAYAIDPFTLVTGKVLQGYERLEDAQVNCRAGKFDGKHYRYINGLTRTVSEVYTDLDDVVLAYTGAWELVDAQLD